MRLLLFVAILLAAPPTSALELEWILIGDADNPGDTEIMSCCGSSTGITGYGSVPYEYEIAASEVTNTEYAAFLNAVAASDPNGVYNEWMGADPSHVFGGIDRSGDPGSYSYLVKPGFASKPVVFVSFYDALRFANWLHNGQPTGAQGPGTTEDGAYTITPAGVADNTITRNPGASHFVTSEDEWYKAAYYDAELELYYDYPAGTDTPTVCAAPGATPNTANCDDATGGFRLSEVGAYTGSASPYGTFDQGGNVWEWNETIVDVGDFTNRGLRGGNWDKPPNQLHASVAQSFPPLAESGDNGFRVARLVPEPGQALLVVTGALLLLSVRLRAERRPSRPS